MKIVIDSLDELKELAYIISHGVYACDEAQRAHEQVTNNLTVHVDGKLPADIAKPADPYADMAAAVYGHDLHPEGYRPTEELPTSASADKAVAETAVALRDMDTGPTKFVITDEPADPGFVASIVCTELDSTGRRWDEEIDSATKKQTKAGAWVRSKRRDLTDERYNERAAELLAEAQATAADEPVATERHALPVDEVTHVALTDKAPDPNCKVAETKPAVDLAALIEASADASLELSGSMSDLMAASRTFIEAHGVAAMNELRAAVAPDPNNPAVGLSVGSLTPAQRALVQACIENYPE